MPTDIRGLRLTAASQEAADAYDRTIEAYLASGPETADLLAATLAADPDMPMAHVLRGYLMNLAGRAEMLVRARDSFAEAQRRAGGATARERAHVAALAAWCDLDLRRAIAILEEILVEHPRDLLAARLAHYLHFYLGELLPMRDSVARLLPCWDEGVPGYGFLLGCRAFGLEETGDYAAAEAAGRRAVEIDARDIWAGHAVAHVLEMQGRCREGIEWVDQHENVWATRNAFANHVWWHRCLYYLELQQHDAVLDQFDRLVWRGTSDDNLDITNAAALLMRLEMLGVDVGGRWESLTGLCEARIGDHNRPFNDVHFAMPLAATGRTEAVERLLASMRGFAAEAGPNVTVAPILREVGIPIAEAVAAYRRGDYGAAVERLLPVRYAMQALGGSWAQRDVFARLLIEAALRAGRFRLARALLAERLALKPRSAPSWLGYARALDGLGEREAAEAARGRAASLAA